MFFSFVTPLLLLSFTGWFVRYGLQVPVGFNTVFYAGMVGFFGVILYNWVNNVDATDYLSTVPVSVPQVIRTKLIAFLLMTTWIGVGFVVIIAWLNADTRLLWLAIPIVLVTSLYIVVMTAYLTGLRTNSFLFDPGVLARFSVMSMLPDFGLTILSFTIDRDLRLSAIGIGLVLAILGAITYILLKGIDAKWRGTEFGEGWPRGQHHGRQRRLPSSHAYRLAGLSVVLPASGGSPSRQRRHPYERDAPLSRDRGMHRNRADRAGRPPIRHAAVRGSTRLGIRSGCSRLGARALPVRRSPWKSSSLLRRSGVPRDGVDRSACSARPETLMASVRGHRRVLRALPRDGIRDARGSRVELAVPVRGAGDRVRDDRRRPEARSVG